MIDDPHQKGKIIPLTCDVTSKDALQAAAAEVAKQTSFVNVVVANSGRVGAHTGSLYQKVYNNVADFATEHWATSLDMQSSIFNTNVIGTLNTFWAFANLLEKGNTDSSSISRHGYIKSQFITISSAAAHAATESESYEYDTSKAAIEYLTRSLAVNAAKFGIRANCIAPGIFMTDMADFMPEGLEAEKAGAVPAEMIPLTRAGGKEDIAGTALYLCSRAGAYVTGATLLIDGGATANVP